MTTETRETGWYMNGGRAWFWNGDRFSDFIDENAFQHSYADYSTDEEKEEAEQELRDATAQCKVFVHLDGPYAFQQVCDGIKLLTP